MPLAPVVPGTGRPQPGGRHGPGESSSENGHGRGRRGSAQQAGGHPAGVLSMEADDEALKVRECQEIKVKVQRSLKEAEAQSFQLYRPRWTMREHWEPRSSEPDGGARSWSRRKGGDLEG